MKKKKDEVVSLEAEYKRFERLALREGAPAAESMYFRSMAASTAGRIERLKHKNYRDD